MAESKVDPPRPPDGSPAATAGHIAAVTVLIAADLATGGVLGAIAAIPGGDASDPTPDPAYLAELARTTAPPRRLDDGNVVCSRCETAVPFATVSINEHGYFCARCVEAP